MNWYWRLAHLWLALVSAVFLFLLAATGFILSFEPFVEKTQFTEAQIDDQLTLAELLPRLNEKFDEILEIQVDAYQRLSIEALGAEDKMVGRVYINPNSLEIIAEVPKSNVFFQWVRQFHRSFMLKSTGRWLVGITSIFLVLISISGIFVTARRQQGWGNFFKPIKPTNFTTFSHIFLGRYMLIPLFFIALTGSILFLFRAEFFNENKTEIITFSPDNSTEKDLKDFAYFNQALKNFQKIEFPFSADPDEFYTLHLADKVLEVNAFSGEIQQEIYFSNHKKLKDFSYFLHTGEGSWWIPIFLILGSLSILYFIYSGLKMASKRLMKSKNQWLAEDAEIVILYGSENGATQRFAMNFFKALVEKKQKVFIATMNELQNFPKLKQLIIMTSTYGDGEAPNNAHKFTEKFQQYIQNQTFEYSIVGFGAREYAQFCQFAKDCDALLNKSKANCLIPSVYIHNQSKIEFQSWWNLWSGKNHLEMPFQTYFKMKEIERKSFKIEQKEIVNDGFSTVFNLILNPIDTLSFESGDLLAVFASPNARERYYSIAKINHRILISIKLHEKGLCSRYLYQLKVGETLQAYIKKNEAFHFPKHQKLMLLIANGTGITPFLGMMQQNPANKVHLLAGFRNIKHFSLYGKYLLITEDENVTLCFSREKEVKRYVQDIVNQQADKIVLNLINGGEIMVCGSLKMYYSVMKILDQNLKKQGLSAYHFVEKKQIKHDCY
ncbi:Cytochrome P450(BM-3) [Candidatus Ornithobacterium hominis]|uniref:PepSY domain-containing protein n=1 Tax=Candidatus Ornithobacterium hominis TaxID=2497989 RepID=UPI0024BCC203|nr:PepSY domain-containing protein [Candidatus Ornithobacterium hominis]CAI9428794.1 Cytochrome P450(BM-3) [Candidatus Ornithobacterium hominis]